MSIVGLSVNVEWRFWWTITLTLRQKPFQVRGFWRRYWVNELIKSVLVPVIGHILKDNPERPRDALLKLKIVDPACGSGHFLLAAARQVAAEIARLDAGPDT